MPLTGENVKPDEEDGHLDRTERVDDEPDAEDGGELQRHRLGRGCRPPSSRRRSAGWPPHLASCGAPATPRHIAAERASITDGYLSMSIRRSGRRCECAQVSYGIRRCRANYLRWPSAGERTSVAVCIELVGQPVEDGRRLRVDELQNGALRVDQRRLRGEEEAAKAGAARAGGSTLLLKEPEAAGQPRPTKGSRDQNHCPPALRIT